MRNAEGRNGWTPSESAVTTALKGVTTGEPVAGKLARRVREATNGKAPSLIGYLASCRLYSMRGGWRGTSLAQPPTLLRGNLTGLGVQVVEGDLAPMHVEAALRWPLGTSLRSSYVVRLSSRNEPRGPFPSTCHLSRIYCHIRGLDLPRPLSDAHEDYSPRPGWDGDGPTAHVSFLIKPLLPPLL
jgi:hypothetical protein